MADQKQTVTLPNRRELNASLPPAAVRYIEELERRLSELERWKAQQEQAAP